MHIVVNLIFILIKKRVFEVFHTVLDLAEESRLKINLRFFLDLTVAQFQSHLHIVVDLLFILIKKRVFEAFLTILDLAEETRLRINP